MLSVRDAYQQADHTQDFEYEHAVLDDDEGSRSPRPGQRNSVVPPSPNIPAIHEERPSLSTSPVLERTNTYRRARLVNPELNPSNASIKSHRTVSPPNSVEAFSKNRRARAGTAGSVAPSFVTFQGGPSASVHRERRPTFSDVRSDRPDAADNSSQGSVEDDVCFPQEEPSQGSLIDYDELDDFVARYRNTPTTIPIPFGDKLSLTSCDQRTRVFHELCSGKKPDTTLSKPTSSSIPNKNNRRPSEAQTLDGDSSNFSEKEKAAASADALESVPVPPEPINRWSFFSSDLEDTIHAPELGDLLMPGETFQHLFELGPTGGVWWLDMMMPSEEEIEVICKAFGIHGLTREDIVQQETREKVELFKSYYFVCFRSFYQMDRNSECFLEPVNVYAVVFREGILTFTFCPSPHAANVRKRMSKLREYVSLGADWICYALIDDIVDSYGPVIHEVETESETIEDNVFTARTEDSLAILKQIGMCRKTVMSLIRLLGGKADVIKGFAKRCNEQYSIAPRQDVGLYLSDIQDHVVTMMSNLGHFEKMLSRSHANYLAQISVDNIAQGNRANEVLSKVTFIATVLVPLNLVCGLFGMNVEVPGKNATGLGWFFGILGSLFLFVGIVTIIARRKRWI